MNVASASVSSVSASWARPASLISFIAIRQASARSAMSPAGVGSASAGSTSATTQARRNAHADDGLSRCRPVLDHSADGFALGVERLELRAVAHLASDDLVSVAQGVDHFVSLSGCCVVVLSSEWPDPIGQDRKSTRLNSSHVKI